MTSITAISSYHLMGAWETRLFSAKPPGFEDFITPLLSNGQVRRAEGGSAS
jgi:hypothetical protein